MWPATGRGKPHIPQMSNWTPGKVLHTPSGPRLPTTQSTSWSAPKQKWHEASVEPPSEYNEQTTYSNLNTNCEDDAACSVENVYQDSNEFENEQYYDEEEEEEEEGDLVSYLDTEFDDGSINQTDYVNYGDGQFETHENANDLYAAQIDKEGKQSAVYDVSECHDQRLDANRVGTPSPHPDMRNENEKSTSYQHHNYLAKASLDNMTRDPNSVAYSDDERSEEEDSDFEDEEFYNEQPAVYGQRYSEMFCDMPQNAMHSPANSFSHYPTGRQSCGQNKMYRSRLQVPKRATPLRSRGVVGRNRSGSHDVTRMSSPRRNPVPRSVYHRGDRFLANPPRSNMAESQSTGSISTAGIPLIQSPFGSQQNARCPSLPGRALPSPHALRPQSSPNPARPQSSLNQSRSDTSQTPSTREMDVPMNLPNTTPKSRPRQNYPILHQRPKLMPRFGRLRGRLPAPSQSRLPSPPVLTNRPPSHSSPKKADHFHNTVLSSPLRLPQRPADMSVIPSGGSVRYPQNTSGRLSRQAPPQCFRNTTPRQYYGRQPNGVSEPGSICEEFDDSEGSEEESDEFNDDDDGDCIDEASHCFPTPLPNHHIPNKNKGDLQNFRRIPSHCGSQLYYSLSSGPSSLQCITSSNTGYSHSSSQFHRDSYYDDEERDSDQESSEDDEDSPDSGLHNIPNHFIPNSVYPLKRLPNSPSNPKLHPAVTMSSEQHRQPNIVNHTLSNSRIDGGGAKQHSEDSSVQSDNSNVRHSSSSPSISGHTTTVIPTYSTVGCQVASYASSTTTQKPEKADVSGVNTDLVHSSVRFPHRPKQIPVGPKSSGVASFPGDSMNSIQMNTRPCGKPMPLPRSPRRNTPLHRNVRRDSQGPRHAGNVVATPNSVVNPSSGMVNSSSHRLSHKRDTCPDESEPESFLKKTCGKIISFASSLSPFSTSPPTPKKKPNIHHPPHKYEWSSDEDEGISPTPPGNPPVSGHHFYITHHMLSVPPSSSCSRTMPPSSEQMNEDPNVVNSTFSQSSNEGDHVRHTSASGPVLNLISPEKTIHEQERRERKLAANQFIVCKRCGTLSKHTLYCDSCGAPHSDGAKAFTKLGSYVLHNRHLPIDSAKFYGKKFEQFLPSDKTQKVIPQPVVTLRDIPKNKPQKRRKKRAAPEMIFLSDDEGGETPRSQNPPVVYIDQYPSPDKNRGRGRGMGPRCRRMANSRVRRVHKHAPRGRWVMSSDSESSFMEENKLQVNIHIMFLGTLHCTPIVPFIFDQNRILCDIDTELRPISNRFEIFANDLRTIKSCRIDERTLFVITTTPAFGNRVRSFFNLSNKFTENDPYFDPGSDDIRHQYVVMVIQDFEDEIHSRLIEIFHMMNPSPEFFQTVTPQDMPQIPEVVEWIYHDDEVNEGFNEEEDDRETQEYEDEVMIIPHVPHMVDSESPDVHIITSPEQDIGEDEDMPFQDHHLMYEEGLDMPIFSEPIIRFFTYPPPPAKGGYCVTNEDVFCLTKGVFLNDVIIDFYLKYLFDTKLSAEMKLKTYIFNSFFYKRLSQRVTRVTSGHGAASAIDLKTRRHQHVKAWTKNVDLFSKDFIIVPINEHSHWFLAIICFPWLAQYPDYQSMPAGERPEDTSTEMEEVYQNTGPRENGRDTKKRACILVFDSLAGPSRAFIIKLLREYLQVEWDSRKHEPCSFTKDTIRGCSPKVPQQDNFSDCGLYVLQYVESFFERPIIDYNTPLRGLETWFETEVVRSKRDSIRNIIMNLKEKFDKEATT